MTYFLFIIIFLVFFGGIFPDINDITKYIVPASVLVVFLYNASSMQRVLYKNEKRILLGVVIAFLMLLFLFKVEQIGYLYGSLMLPALLIALIRQNKSPKIVYALWGFIVSLFIVEIVIAIYERVTMQNLFYSNLSTWDEDYHNEGLDFIFRSTALLGHPLNNAMFVAMGMNLLLVLKIKFIYKLPLWCLGFISLLCFNARGSTILSVVCFVSYLLFIGQSHGFTKILVVIIGGIALYYMIDIVKDTSLAGRLASGELMDGSAQTRFDIWRPLGFADIGDLLFGFSPQRYKELQSALKLYTSENWLAMFFYKIGIPLTLFFCYYYYQLMRHLLYGIPSRIAYFLIVSFLLISFTNNSLAVTPIPTITALFSFYTYSYFYRKNKSYLLC